MQLNFQISTGKLENVYCEEAIANPYLRFQLDFCLNPSFQTSPKSTFRTCWKNWDTSSWLRVEFLVNSEVIWQRGSWDKGYPKKQKENLLFRCQLFHKHVFVSRQWQAWNAYGYCSLLLNCLLLRSHSKTKLHYLKCSCILFDS